MLRNCLRYTIPILSKIEPDQNEKLMAKCDEGYICDVCDNDVGKITDSDLYLRFVIGMVDPETLHTIPERHIRCNPTLAQFIVDDSFEPVTIDDEFDKRQLDPSYVAQREDLVTRGYRRLAELQDMEGPITNYPLAEVRDRLAKQK